MLLTLFVFFYQITTGNGLECAACFNVSSPTDCHTYQTCNVGDRCYTASYGVGMDTYFDMGCRTESDCLGTQIAGLVGRSVGQIQCGQCCVIDHCNDKLCSKGTQVDGAWNLWSPWSACDVSCGMGTLTKSRTCTDPPPAHGGLPCVGNTTDMKHCTLSACRNGGWSSWSQWSTCSHGLSTRTRACTNPHPSQFGRDCDGKIEENIGCRHTVAFAVTTPDKTLIDGLPIFTRIITNVGGGYDPNTAKFTCPVTGLYTFTFRICSSGKYAVSCWIYKNGAGRIFAQTSADNAFDTSATSTYFQLTVGDVVYPGSCSNWEHVRAYYDSSFSGALIES